MSDCGPRDLAPHGSPIGALQGGLVMGLLFAFMLLGIPLLFAVYDLTQTKS